MTFDSSELDSSGLTALQRAVLAGDAELVADLIKRGADPNDVAVSPDGRLGTPLLAAVTLRDPAVRLEMVRALLDAGARVNRLVYDGKNVLLHYVIAHARHGSGATDLVCLLLDHGARPDPELVDLAHERSLFNVEYMLRRGDAVKTPVEDNHNAGCCLVPLVAVALAVGIVAYIVYQYWDYIFT